MIVEQINIYGNLEFAEDQKLVKSKDYMDLFISLGLKPVMLDRSKNIIKIDETILFLANITYLGNPHPSFKKRIQLKKWWKEKYYEYTELGYKVKFIGVYKFNENAIFADLNIDDYIGNKFNNSSAHIMINDLYQAMNIEVFSKTDKNNNNIKLIRKVYFKDYILNKVFHKHVHPLVETIDIINQFIPFQQKLSGIDCYSEMITENFKNKFQPEWPGFYLEYLYEKILSKNIDSNLLCINVTSKQEDALDFDLYSPRYQFYSDLKASDSAKKETPLNDQLNVIKTLEQNGRLWYLIYEHDTLKDKDNGLKVCNYWNTQLNLFKGVNKELTSYSNRMKSEITFNKMYLIEINKINAAEILKEFNQGINSNGSVRKEKFKINKKDIENYIIYRYEV